MVGHSRACSSEDRLRGQAEDRQSISFFQTTPLSVDLRDFSWGVKHLPQMILVIVIQTQSFEGILCDTDSPDGCSGAHEHWQPDFGTDHGNNAFQPLTQRTNTCILLRDTEHVNYVWTPLFSSREYETHMFADHRSPRCIWSVTVVQGYSGE